MLTKYNAAASAAALEGMPNSISPYPLGFNYSAYELLSDIRMVAVLVGWAASIILLICLYREAAISDKEALGESK